MRHEKQETCQVKIWEKSIHKKQYFSNCRPCSTCGPMKSIRGGGTTIEKNILEDITWNKTFVSVIHRCLYIGDLPTRVTVLTVFLTLVTSNKSVKALRAGKSLVSYRGKVASMAEHWGGVVWNEVGSACSFPTFNVQPAPQIWTATSSLIMVHHQETRWQDALSALVSLCKWSLGQVSSYTNVTLNSLSEECMLQWECIT